MPKQILQLFLLGLNGKTTILRIDKNASIANLREKTQELSGIPADEIRLIYTTKELQDTNDKGKNLYLNDFNIKDESTLFLVLRLRGGSNTQKDGTVTVETSEEYLSEELENLDPPPKELPPDVELTSEPDMITFDDDEGGQRAKMPCGHAIGPESLTAYCRSLLSNKKYEFRCPHHPPCGRLWDYYTVEKLAVLTQEEKKEFQTKIAENYLMKGLGIQECPSCSSFCERQNRNNARVICPICTRTRKRLYEFCWYCLRQWKTNGTKECGNSDCSGENPRLRILKSAPKKVIIGLEGCPSVRACPKCGLLIEHTDACKHMLCPCGQRFCFLCLKKAVDNRFLCGSYRTKCELAPVQTELP